MGFLFWVDVVVFYLIVYLWDHWFGDYVVLIKNPFEWDQFVWDGVPFQLQNFSPSHCVFWRSGFLICFFFFLIDGGVGELPKKLYESFYLLVILECLLVFEIIRYWRYVYDLYLISEECILWGPKISYCYSKEVNDVVKLHLFKILSWMYVLWPTYPSFMKWNYTLYTNPNLN